MKKEIPWELIISDLKQDISDADKKHLEEWVSIDENRKVYEELRGVWEKVRAKVINYTPDVDFYWKELMQRMEECEDAEQRQAWKSHLQHGRQRQSLCPKIPRHYHERAGGIHRLQ